MPLALNLLLILLMIELEFIGAAQTVTGSKHLLRTSRARVLLDCGLFQGRRKEANEKNRLIPVDVNHLDAVVLSHAHIDHSGAMPMLFKMGYRGPVYTTPATQDLCAPMLMDTAYLMRSDAEHIARLIAKGVKHLDPVEPLYDQDDVSGILSQFIGLPYHQSHQIAPGITLRFLYAGHVLGSALSVIDVEDEGQKLRLVFTGDLGHSQLPILHDPEIPEKVDYLLMESTYGDRLHDPLELTLKTLAEVIRKTHARGGKVIVPSFALERAQELIFSLHRMFDEGGLPPIPVYVDSPLTVKLTDVFKLHPECYDHETFALLQSEKSIFDFPGLTYISSVEDSKRVSTSSEPCIVISASGMCEGGRILHHLQAGIEDPKNTILIVGYQAESTLGRRLVEGRAEVRIFGQLYRLQAEVCVLNGFSGHADQRGLLDFAQAVRAKGDLKQIMLVHGETTAQLSFEKLLNEQHIQSVAIPRPGDRLRLA